jgi:hypothetical protein
MTRIPSSVDFHHLKSLRYNLGIDITATVIITQESVMLTTQIAHARVRHLTLAVDLNTKIITTYHLWTLELNGASIASLMKLQQLHTMFHENRSVG